MLKFTFAERAAICDGSPVVYACIAKPVIWNPIMYLSSQSFEQIKQ